MIQTISIKDTRNNLAELVDRVAIAGEEFVLTKFGKPRAMLIPLSKATSLGTTSFDEVFGAWKDRPDLKDSAQWVKNLRTKLSVRATNE